MTKEELRQKFNEFFIKTEGRNYTELNDSDKKEFDILKEEEEFFEEYERNKQEYFETKDGEL